MANERLGSPDITFAVGNGPVRAGVWNESNPINFQSPWTGRRTLLRRWASWRLLFEWDLLPHARAMIVRAAFGVYDTHTKFKILDPARLKVTGDATDAQLDGLKVDGGSQTGQTLNIKMTASVAAVLLFKAGDLIAPFTTGEVFEVAADATTDGAGLVAVSLVQFIATSPNDSEQLLTENVPFTVVQTKSLGSQMQHATAHTFRAEMEEALLP